jgi:hypothetical protein
MSGLNSSGVTPLMEAASIASSAYGQYTGDGSGAVTVYLGFSPNWVKVYDETDGLSWEWNAGLAATHSLKTTFSTGVVTVDTGSAIVSNHVISSRTVPGVYLPSGNGAGDGTLGNTSVTVDAPDQTLPKLILATGLNTSSSLYGFVAQG